MPNLEKSYRGLFYGKYEPFLEDVTAKLTSHTFHAFHSRLVEYQV